jgi:hypothetical protein
MSDASLSKLHARGHLEGPLAALHAVAVLERVAGDDLAPELRPSMARRRG